MLTKKLLRCRACRLTWFPNPGAAAACPACGGKEVGGKLELFHVGIALIALALIGWMRPLIEQGPLGAAIPAVINAKKLTVDVERGPAEGQAVTLRRGEKVTILERKDRRVLVKDRRGNQVYVPSDKVNSRKKTRTRRQHVQR